MKNHVLKFRTANRDIFEAILSGTKKIETRAATQRYRKIKAGDKVELVCGKDRFEKRVKEVELFKSVSGMLRKHKVQEINPSVSSKEELEKIYYSFPKYREKIAKYGLIALRVK